MQEKECASPSAHAPSCSCSEVFAHRPTWGPQSGVHIHCLSPAPHPVLVSLLHTACSNTWEHAAATSRPSNTQPWMRGVCARGSPVALAPHPVMASAVSKHRSSNQSRKHRSAPAFFCSFVAHERVFPDPAAMSGFKNTNSMSDTGRRGVTPRTAGRCALGAAAAHTIAQQLGTKPTPSKGAASKRALVHL